MTAQSDTVRPPSHTAAPFGPSAGSIQWNPLPTAGQGAALYRLQRVRTAPRVTAPTAVAGAARILIPAPLSNDHIIINSIVQVSMQRGIRRDICVV